MLDGILDDRLGRNAYRLGDGLRKLDAPAGGGAFLLQAMHDDLVVCAGKSAFELDGLRQFKRFASARLERVDRRKDVSGGNT